MFVSAEFVTAAGARCNVHQTDAASFRFFPPLFSFFSCSRERDHHVQPFWVRDANEESFITVIKPAGRLFLQVAALLLSDRPSAWGIAAVRTTPCTTSYSQGWDYILRLRMCSDGADFYLHRWRPTRRSLGTDISSSEWMKSRLVCHTSEMSY